MDILQPTLKKKLFKKQKAGRTGGPAGPVLPSLPRAPCRGQRTLWARPKEKPADYICAAFQWTVEIAGRQTRGLQKVQEVQGGLSRRGDHELPTEDKWMWLNHQMFLIHFFWKCGSALEESKRQNVPWHRGCRSLRGHRALPADEHRRTDQSQRISEEVFGFRSSSVPAYLRTSRSTVSLSSIQTVETLQDRKKMHYHRVTELVVEDLSWNSLCVPWCREVLEFLGIHERPAEETLEFNLVTKKTKPSNQ